jgi:hypothetical protein
VQFKFVVNKKVVLTSVVEAALPGPVVHEHSRVRESVMKDSTFTPEDFVLLSEFADFGQIRLSHLKLESWIELPQKLKNDRLELLLSWIPNDEQIRLNLNLVNI